MRGKRNQRSPQAGKRYAGEDLGVQAANLVRDPRFLYRAGKMIRDLGIVGEERNSLILLLAGIGRTLPTNSSVIVKGSTSSGKSTLVKTVVRLFPPDAVIERASLSPKALAHGKGDLAGKIFVLREYRGGKEAMLLLRLLQSEGQIEHEFTKVRGSQRSTETARRVGTPVVLTTTTESHVFADDETRFLSIWIDESPEQSVAIMTTKAAGVPAEAQQDLPAWRKALSLLVAKKGDFQNPPAWLRYVARQLPLERGVRVRRDWDRFLNFCKAIALSRGDWNPREPVDIAFADYCTAHAILEPVFASTLRGIHSQEIALHKAVSDLNRRFRRAVTTEEISTELGWRMPLVYKFLRSAIRNGLLAFEEGTRQRNIKRVLSHSEDSGRFLPSPRSVLENNPEIGTSVTYVNPFTGASETVRARPVKELKAKGNSGRKAS